MAQISKNIEINIKCVIPMYHTVKRDKDGQRIRVDFVARTKQSKRFIKKLGKLCRKYKCVAIIEKNGG